MHASILIFLVVGAVFGLLTVSRRHLYSEGPAPRGDGDPLAERVLWVVLCTGLWPLMAVARLYGLWVKRPRPVRVDARPSSRPTPRSPRR